MQYLADLVKPSNLNNWIMHPASAGVLVPFTVYWGGKYTSLSNVQSESRDKECSPWRSNTYHIFFTISQYDDLAEQLSHANGTFLDVHALAEMQGWEPHHKIVPCTSLTDT